MTSIIKPIDEVAGRIAAKVRTDSSGSKSLAHVLVVVPTAQSGRRLRLRLAEKLGAVLPPEIRLPAQLLGTDDLVQIAERGDELVAFMEALGDKGSLDVAAQFSDIRGILGGNALLFSDVAERIADILTEETADFEISRWQEFAALEQRYLEALDHRGKTDRIVAMKKAVENPKRLEGIEEVVLAYVLDPLPAMRKVLETLKQRDSITVEEILPRQSEAPFALLASQIIPCATSASEAEQVAAIFADVKPDEALPSLCVADAEEYPELQGAMQAKGVVVHNPSQTPLVTSSLGHLVEQIAALVRTRSYNVFSAFLRGGDVRRWLCAELGLSDDEYVAALVDLDNRQAKLLPEKIDDIGPKTTGKLRAIFEHVDATLRKNGVRQILQHIFKDLILDERDADAREFAAAAEAVNGLLDECFGIGLAPKLAMDLFALRLQETSYSLEPDEGTTVLSDGWLELPFLDADELIITGFNEGRVPESVVGHAFLPDRLRRGLGLADNESRTRRDRAILRMAAECRERVAVKVFFRAIDAKGDVLKPSRLLFDGLDDTELVKRVTRFYKVRVGTEEARTADLPEGWRLRLPVPPAHSQLDFTSPSSLDLYLRCPFTYCLKKTFDEKMDDRAEELDASEFGSLAHDALELWGNGPLKDSEDEDAIADELARHVDEILGKRFGTSVPAIVALQGDSIKRRLAAFARIQVARHKDGWRTIATERRLQVVYGHTTVKGRCDRIDFNERTNEWCVIDYKTFDNPDRAVAYDQKKQEWKSLQLPLYCAMLDADGEFSEAKLERISSAYCVLGKTHETTLFTPPMNGAFVPEAEMKVRELIGCIERGIFWPPSTKNEWQWDFKSWIFNTPEESVSLSWLEDQLARLPDTNGESLDE